jgi:YD repeat-containing protein
MGLFRGAPKGRSRWLAVFTLLLFVPSAVPVLADPAPDDQPPTETGTESSPLPDGADLAEAEEKVEEEEAKRDLELESPKVVAEREESELAYTDLESAGAISDLLRSSFGEELASLELDPARFLSDATLKRNLGNDGGAVVTSEGKTELIDSEIPAQVRDEDGQLSKVDLSLNATPEGFEPENPITALTIPTSAADGISIGTSGETSITQVGVDPESSAHLFGDKDVIYPEVQTDTDLLVSPLATGVEFYDQLRSIESPETVRFDLSLPEGGELRANAGAAEVYKGENLTAIVSPPHAVDAQGTLVPVTMDIQANSLILDIPHREGDYAYPILVDPEYTQNDWVNCAWVSGSCLGPIEDNTFIPNANNAGLYWGKSCIRACWGSGRGLFVSFPSGNFGPQQFAQWTYTPPGQTSYLTGYQLNPIWRYDYTSPCWSGPHPTPIDFDGLWTPESPYNGWTAFYTNRSLAGNAVLYNSYGRVLIFGMSSSSGSNDPCWRDLYVGGIATYMSDPDYPTLDTISGQPTGWFDDSKTYGVNVSAHDKGLGVQNVQLLLEGMPEVFLKPAPCYGTHDSPCSRDMSGPILFNGDNFREGRSLAKVVASDALSRASASQSWWAYVDSTPPKITLSGQLATATNEAGSKEVAPGTGDQLNLPVYHLTIEAEDGEATSDKTRRSGVKNIEVFLDSKKEAETVPWSAKPTPCENCAMTQTYALKLHELASGNHTLKVFAVDQLGHKSERSIEFEYIPATGMKDEYVMQYFPLPDGLGNEVEEEHPARPELAVNVMNGNLIYRERDVDVEGYGTDLEVERFYNSQLPTAENTEWGDGWTLAQTPTFAPETDPPYVEAELVDPSGTLEKGVQLPTEVGKTNFDPSLQATVTKEAGGGYELADESGGTDTAIAFDTSGRTTELRTDGYAKVDYDYEAGKLEKIAVKDPASASDLSEAEEEVLEYVPPAPSYKSAFGALGGADGQLKAPADIAIAANGDLFVVDRGNNRIERFNQEGKFVSKFGSEGTANGQFKRPCSIAIDPSGYLWVADADNNRIQKFTEGGAFIKAIGSYGTGDAQFSKPEGIATNSQGYVYVADTFNSRIQKFTSAGEFVSKIGSLGSGNGKFNQPVGVDIGPGGKLWVADRGTHRLTEFDAESKFVLIVGSQGTGNGQFQSPEAIEVDSRGNVFVGDRANNRIQQFSPTGKYLTKFGSQGTGAGQFNLQWPMGIAVDNLGGLWVTDVGNHRIQKWSVPNYRPNWFGAIGAVGSADGQFKAPSDVEIAPNGNIWMVDRTNNRIQQFTPDGKFVSKFGSQGTPDGQFNWPASIAIDTAGNIFIVDTSNNRIQKFDENGKFIMKFGYYGTLNTQFNKPAGIATDLKGNVYVADTYNSRIQVFDEEGKFLFKFGTYGTGPGQFTEASAIDIGRGGKIWVADSAANRIQQFNEKGEFVLQFGSAGTGEGQFNHPQAIEADNKGNVWVGDQGNGRVQLFNEAGEYVTQFGTKGSGEGQFSFTYPMGIASDWGGGLWIADGNNNRIQKWQIPNTEAPKVPEENDPSVDVKLSSGLVSSVEGDEAGVNTYAHAGELLTANKGPDGETKYTYDSAGRMTKVTLPNGTWGEITYNVTSGRVSKVRVDPAGAAPAQSTTFSYSDEPRRTTVTPEGAPIVTYDIGADGSVLKWQNTKKPPTFTNISGSLYANKGKLLNTGVHNLIVQANSAEGIESIQIVANGSELVSEKICTQEAPTPPVECVNEKDEWVTETENHPPGILNLEVIIKDRTGEAAAERFWVNIPQPPPPPPAGAPVKPKFKEILNFREEFGLEVWDPVSGETELNERIFNLINAWTEGEPVARASWERWGVPLRPSDVAEMEYREHYVAHDGPGILDWAATNAPATYAGYYVDHRAGGIVHVGFTTSQEALVAQLKNNAALMAKDRLAPYISQPQHSMAYLEALQMEIAGVDALSGPLAGLITRVGIDVQANAVTVGTPNPSQAETGLDSIHGATAPIMVYVDSSQEGLLEGHFIDEGPIRPGIAVGFAEENKPNYCTAGFAAREKTNKLNPATRQEIVESYLLVTGHCWASFGTGFVVRRFHSSSDATPSKIGTLTRRSNAYKQKGFSTDAAAILLEGGIPLSSSVFRMGASPRPVAGVAQATQGMIIHKSGAGSKVVKTGRVTGPAEAVVFHALAALGKNEGGPYFLVPNTIPGARGDSGGPIWTEDGQAVGLVSFGGPDRSAFSPLLSPQLPTPFQGEVPPKPEQAPGILHAPGMGELHVMKSP